MDQFYVYRPLLDLIGFTEGTDKGRGYDETLAYGAYTGGAVDLVGMSLAEVDALQTKMLKHPKNKLRSSACGRYQIVRTTLRAIRQALNLAESEKFDARMQDRMACYLLGQRGVDKYLAGRLSEDTLLTNLAKEWASLPTPAGRGYYDGQHAAVKPDRVRAVLAEVRERHRAGQPANVPPAVEREVEKTERNAWWQWLTVLPLTGIGAFFQDHPEIAYPALVGVAVVAAVALVGGRRLVRRVKDIVDEARG